MQPTIRISLLHAALRFDDVAENMRVLEAMFMQALTAKPDLIVMPELAISGYEFAATLGQDWISETVPAAIERFAGLARQHQVALVLASPRFDSESGEFFNTAFFIDVHGQILGQHDKINVLPGSEGWASRGAGVAAFAWRGHKLGLLICSDAYSEEYAAELAEQGAQVLISPANWSPGLYGPDGEWEQRSADTGLTLIVCNRTGKEVEMDFSGSASVVAVAGQRRLSYVEHAPAILSVDLRTADWRPVSERYMVMEFEG